MELNESGEISSSEMSSSSEGAGTGYNGHEKAGQDDWGKRLEAVVESGKNVK